MNTHRHNWALDVRRMDRERGRTDGWRARMNGQALDAAFPHASAKPHYREGWREGWHDCDAALSGKGPHCDRDWLRPLRLAS